MPDLIMQAAQYALGGPAVVILDKLNIQSGGLLKFALVKTFKKETPGI